MSIFQIFVRALISYTAYSVARKVVNGGSGGVKKMIFQSWKVSRCPECLGLYRYIKVCPLCSEDLEPEYRDERYYRREDYNRDWQERSDYDRS